MQQNRRVILVFAAFAILIIAFFYLTADNTQSRFDWTETYDKKSDQPFGTKAFLGMLKDQYAAGDFKVLHKPMRKALLDTSGIDSSTYLFVGESMFVDSNDVEVLMDYVGRGNTAFISSKDVPEELMHYLYGAECGEWKGYFEYLDTMPAFYFSHPQFNRDSSCRFGVRVKDELRTYNWRCFDGSYFCDSLNSWTTIGYMNGGYVNLVRIKHLDGVIYLHTTPLLFTNYFTRQEQGYTYLSSLFSHFSGNKLLWDDYSRLPMIDNYSAGTQSPFSYILSQKPLRWAWYILLAAAILYVAFRARRRQRTIPVIVPNQNSSLEFLNVISTLYYNESDHKEAAVQKMKYFLSFIRSRYHLLTNKIDQPFCKKLAIRSQVDIKLIENLFHQYEVIQEYHDISSDRLETLHYCIEKFYLTCK